MHTDSNTEFQNLIPVITSNVSSNRIKIQEILLILQLETDYFSKLFISECSIRSSDITVFTETSRTAILHEEVLQDSSAPTPAPTLHVHITLQSREFSIQDPILHAEDKELFEYYSPVPRNSTHRRQGDLLEMHPCVLHDIPGNSSCSRDIPDIPVIHDLPAFPGNSTNSTMFQYLQGIHPIPAFSD